MRLSIDTSTLTLSLALEVDGNVVASRHTYLRSGHSRILTSEVQSILTSVDVGAKDLEQIVVGRGPGSFTGLRIGFAFALGLSRSLNIPVAARYSFAGFAAVLPPGQRVACAVDARKKEVYGGIWTTGPSARRLSPETTWKPRQFARHCHENHGGGELILCGNGFARYADEFDGLVGRYGDIPYGRRAPDAAGLLVWNEYPRDETDEPIEPLYIRPSEAEFGKSGR